MRSPVRFLCPLLALVSLLPSRVAAIDDDFSSGNLSGGSGWLGSWSTGTVTNSAPLDSGGNYLSLTALTGSSGSVRQWSSAAVSSTAAYTVRFDVRVDALPDFGTVNGRLGITESSSNATNTSTLMSWMIFGTPNFGLGNGSQPTWGFHDGNGSGNFNSILVNSGAPLIAGRVYRFEVIVSPAELAYAVVLDDLADASPAYHSPRLGFRRSSTIANPWLSFSTQSVTGSGAMSVDAVSVTAGGTLPDEPLPAATVADRVSGNLILLNDNGGWSWYQDERVLHDPTNGKILFTSAANHLGYGGEPRDGDIDTVSFDPATGARQRFILGNLPFTSPSSGDDHNIGALWRRADGRYLATWCNHNDTTRNTRMRISTNPGDNSAWNPQFTFNWSAAPGTNARSVTYSNLLFLANEGSGQGRLYNIAREQNRDPHLSYSDDQGNTWAYGGRLSTQPSSLGYSNGYFKYKSNGTNRIDFICTEAHPRDVDTSIYHGYIQGGKSYNSLGVVIDGNIFDDTAPTPQSFTKVWASQGVTATSYHHGWTSELELDSDGRPVILFTTRYGNTVTDGHAGANDHRIFHGRFNGAAWVTTELGKNGELFHAGEQDYTGIGSIHPDKADTIYISTYIHPATGAAFASKKREIFQGKTADQGVSWAWTQLTFDSTVDNGRPIIPSWDADHTALLWWRGDYPWQRDYDLSVVGMIVDPDFKVGSIAYHDATPFNTTLANGSPMTSSGPDATTGSNTDHQWHESTGIGGNGGSVYVANFSSTELTPAENAPALKTRITGLADGTYDVFAYFVSPPAAGDWRIAAGSTENGTLNFRRASSQQAEATHFDGAVETLWATKGTALYRAYVGRKVVAGGSAIEVFIDDAPSSVAYDGIGVARVLPNLRVAPGESTSMTDDDTPYGDIVNDGTLIVKGSTAPLFEGTFTNNGFLDLLTYTGELPVFTNHGSVLFPGEGLIIRDFDFNAGTAAVTIDSHAGHGYRLQSSATLGPNDWEDTGTPVNGLGTGGSPVPLILQGSYQGSTRCFFRVVVE